MFDSEDTTRVPGRVYDLQLEQETLVANQQSDLAESIRKHGPEGRGWHFNELGADAENLMIEAATLAAPIDATIEQQPIVGAPGRGTRMDLRIESGGRIVALEGKYSLPTTGEAFDRVSEQLSGGHASIAEDDTLLLSVARPPSEAETNTFFSKLHQDLEDRVQVVSNLPDLYRAVREAFDRGRR